MPTKLKPCPFCGKEAELEIKIREDDLYPPRDHWHARVECEWCGATHGWHKASKQEAKKADPKLVQIAINQWNKRCGL